MTDVDKPAFLQAFNALAVALREAPPDAAQYRVYFAALVDVDLDFVVLAAKQLSATATYFPKTSEWREAAQAIARRRRLEQRELMRKCALFGVPLCPRCNDTGWELVDADANVTRRCDCQELRRLELVGRRPWPALPAAPRPLMSDALDTRQDDDR